MHICTSYSENTITDIFSEFDEERNDISLSHDNEWLNPDEKKGNSLIPKNNFQYIDCNMGLIKMIDISTGDFKEILVNNDEEYFFLDMIIDIKRCVKQDVASISDVYKAFIRVRDKNSDDIIFNGWVISGYKSAAQPYHGGYSINLSKCVLK